MAADGAAGSIVPEPTGHIVQKRTASIIQGPKVKGPNAGGRTGGPFARADQAGADAMPHFGMPRRDFGVTNSKMQVNWRRGFFRVWLLASGAWIMSWVLWLMIYGISKGFRDMHEIFAVPVLLFGPPVALMLFGLVAGWAFRGFKPDEDGK